MEALRKQGSCSAAPPTLSLSKRIVHWFYTGPLVGAAIGAIFVLWPWFTVDWTPEALLGPAPLTSQTTAMVDHIIIQTLWYSLAWAMGLGLVFGAVARTLCDAWATAQGRPIVSRRSFIRRVAILVLSMHAWLITRTMVANPQSLLTDAGAGMKAWHALADGLTLEFIDFIGWCSVLIALYFCVRALKRSGWYRIRSWSNRHRWSAGGAVFLAVALLWWNTDRTKPAAPSQSHKNLVLIVLDSQPITPTADTESVLQKDAWRFENAWSPIPSAGAAWQSLISGQYPHRHGVRHAFSPPLAPENDWITSLNSAGFRTAYFSSSVASPTDGTAFGHRDANNPESSVPEYMRRAVIARQPALLAAFFQWPDGAPRWTGITGFQSPRATATVTERALDWVTQDTATPFALVVRYGTDTQHPVNRRTRPGDPAVQKAAATAIDTLWERFQQLELSHNTLVVYAVLHRTGTADVTSAHVPLWIRTPGQSPEGPDPRTAVSLVDVAPTVQSLLSLPPLEGIDGINRWAGEDTSSTPVFVESTGVPSPNNNDTLEAINLPGDIVIDAETLGPVLDDGLDDEILMAKQRTIVRDGFRLTYTPQRTGVRWTLLPLGTPTSTSAPWISLETNRFNRLRERLMRWTLADPKMTPVGDYWMPKQTFPKVSSSR